MTSQQYVIGAQRLLAVEPASTADIKICPNDKCGVSLADAKPSEHFVACSQAATTHRAHRVLADVVQAIVADANVGMVLTEVQGLNGPESQARPGDVVCLHYNSADAESHLVIDVNFTRVFTASAQSKFKNNIAGLLRATEARKETDQTRQDLDSAHSFVPFIATEHGRIGQAALQLLDDLSRRAAAGVAQRGGMTWKGQQRYAATRRAEWEMAISCAIARIMAQLIMDAAQRVPPRRTTRPLDSG